MCWLLTVRKKNWWCPLWLSTPRVLRGAFSSVPRCPRLPELPAPRPRAVFSGLAYFTGSVLFCANPLSFQGSELPFS